MTNQRNNERSFEQIKIYLHLNGLQINATKTTLIEFMCRQKRAKIKGIPPELTVKGLNINQDKHILDSQISRTLGANLRNDMSWDSHLRTGPKAVLPSVRRQIGALYRIGRNMSKNGRLQLTNALAMSRLTYLITLWDNTTPTTVLRAQRTQNIAARCVSGLGRETSIRKLLTECNRLCIRELSDYYSTLHIWKTINWRKPDYLRQKLQTETDDRLSTDIPRLQHTEGSFRCRTVVTWNLLPHHLRTYKSIKRFNSGMRSWLMENRTNAEDRDPN